MAKIQHPTMTFLALDKVQMNFDLMGWQMAMYRSTVNAVKDNAKVKMQVFWAVVVAHLAARSLPVPQDTGSNPVTVNFYTTIISCL